MTSGTSSPPLVSVCIPTYNGAGHLAECLESVCAQTYRSLEILVLDDCSTDGTADIAADHARRDARIRLVRNDRNLGLVGNWHRCIELARGDYIKFCFQDDLLYPRCVEALMAAIGDGVRFAFCAREFIFEPGTSPALQQTLEHGRRRIATLFGSGEPITPERFCACILAHMPANIVGEPTVTLMHRDVFKAYGGFNPDFLQLLDLEMWSRIAANETIAHLPEVLARFRVHAAAESARNREQRSYQARVLDGVLLAHEFAFAPAFARMRVIARTLAPPVDVVDRFYEATHWATAVAREGVEAAIDRDAAAAALAAVGSRYPNVLARPPLKYVLARKWRSLKRLVRSAQSTQA